MTLAHGESEMSVTEVDRRSIGKMAESCFKLAFLSEGSALATGLGGEAHGMERARGGELERSRGVEAAWSDPHVRFRVKVEHGAATCEAPNKELPRKVVHRGTSSGLPAIALFIHSISHATFCWKSGGRSVLPLR